MVIQKVQVEYLLLTILDSRLRGNDTFFQSIPSLPVIPAKLVLDSDRGAGIQELIDNLGIVDKQIKNFTIILFFQLFDNISTKTDLSIKDRTAKPNFVAQWSLAWNLFNFIIVIPVVSSQLLVVVESCPSFMYIVLSYRLWQSHITINQNVK